MTVTSGFSQYLENAALNWFRSTTYPAAPATVYLALFTTAPVNGVTAGSVEVTGGSYQRVPITANSVSFLAPSGAAPATSTQGANFTFTTPSAGWGTVTGWALFDAASAGNMLVYAALTVPVAINSGDTVAFLTGNISIGLN
jgi:hypothetical protein